jgi:protein-L-isoaspartate(D-aspartate) O-methyltransferase
MLPSSLAPKWSDYLPTFEGTELSKRLTAMPYHLATLLTPENLYRSLSSAIGLEKFQQFYALDFDNQRNALAETIAETLNPNRAITDAIRKVPLEQFVPASKRRFSYWNGVTWYRGLAGTTPPWLCAYACHSLDLSQGMKILTIGFGYGYLESVMSEMIDNQVAIFSVEVDREILDTGKRIIASLGYNNFHLKLGDGLKRWNNDSFDVIWPTLGCRKIPASWIDELNEGGKLAVFRPLSPEEVAHAREGKWPGWSGSVGSYDEYMQQWWSDMCLSVYKKESTDLIEISRLYEMDNAPFLDKDYGEMHTVDWSRELEGDYEEKLVAAVKKITE